MADQGTFYLGRISPARQVYIGQGEALNVPIVEGAVGMYPGQ